MCGKVPKNKKTYSQFRFSESVLNLAIVFYYNNSTHKCQKRKEYMRALHTHTHTHKQNLRGESHMDYILIALNFRFIHF